MSLFQLIIKATDQGFPEHFTTATVIIDIELDRHNPYFVGTYIKTIDEDSIIGHSVVTVHALDDDMKVGGSFCCFKLSRFCKKI